jgi:predicted nucleic acid-binding protein
LNKRLDLRRATLPHVDVDVTLRDPHDPPVVAAAVAGHADAIVTGDADLLDDEPLTSWLAERGIEILTPAELVQRGFD